jgi:hypothetical protein
VTHSRRPRRKVRARRQTRKAQQGNVRRGGGLLLTAVVLVAAAFALGGLVPLINGALGLAILIGLVAGVEWIGLGR